MKRIPLLFLLPLIALSVATVITAFIFADRSVSDFRAFYTAWSIVMEGEGERLYDLDFQREKQTEAQRRDEVAPVIRVSVVPYINPPHAAVPMAAVVLPLPGPVFTMMSPRRTSSGIQCPQWYGCPARIVNAR